MMMLLTYNNVLVMISSVSESVDLINWNANMHILFLLIFSVSAFTVYCDSNSWWWVCKGIAARPGLICCVNGHNDKLVPSSDGVRKIHEGVRSRGAVSVGKGQNFQTAIVLNEYGIVHNAVRDLVCVWRPQQVDRGVRWWGTHSAIYHKLFWSTYSV